MFEGYLIRLGSADGPELPLKFMRYETYQVSPRMRLDYNSGRNSTGVMHRTVLTHTASKVEFNMPRMDNLSVREFTELIDSYMYDRHKKEITLYYYDPWDDEYHLGNFYIPDVDFTISNIDQYMNKIMYAETRIAFIEL